MKKTARGMVKKHFLFGNKEYWAYGRTVTEAEAAKTAKLAELEAGVADRENPKLDVYFERFTENRRSSTKTATLRNQRNQYRKCADVIIYNNVRFGDIRIADIKPQDVQTVQHALEAMKNSSRTVNDAMSILGHLFNTAIREDLITKNPCRSINKLRRTEPPARNTFHRALTEDEVKRFLEAAKDSHFINVFRLMLSTGMRLGEVAALTEADIDRNYINISRTLTRGEDGGYYIGDSPKTRDSKRRIPLTETTRQILKEQRKLNEILFGSVDLSKPLFRSPWGYLLKENSLNREIRKFTDKLGIEYFTSHSLRATFATRFIEQRPQDYKILSEILGHSDISITLNLYTHVMDDSKIAAMNAISIAL